MFDVPSNLFADTKEIWNNAYSHNETHKVGWSMFTPQIHPPLLCSLLTAKAYVSPILAVPAMCQTWSDNHFEDVQSNFSSVWSFIILGLSVYPLISGSQNTIWKLSLLDVHKRDSTCFISSRYVRASCTALGLDVSSCSLQNSNPTVAQLTLRLHEWTRLIVNDWQGNILSHS